ncbi:uncharacterized protein HD556DRAFT_1436460 [Suillus plorans]|uniref:Uncharacterized protein n=1 Tax=Suillus plorans TaxID=116603 RepID=A0A9P7J739_9AGAM|nr:uncharacterized protein HD556DRAFT_1436460 [Suillus plorans]KAG1806508.1 hypothetical protein HD556DRAFT_1436460 [Suillus plorans]
MASACSFHGVTRQAFLSPNIIFVAKFNDIMPDALPGDFESYFTSDYLKEADQAPPDASEQMAEDESTMNIGASLLFIVD